VPKIYPLDLGNIRVLDEEEPLCSTLHNKFRELSKNFSEKLSQLVVPLRFSILALLTARKCSVFDDNLLQLMDYIINLKFENVHIYKIAKVGEGNSDSSEEGSTSPKAESGSGSNNSGDGGSPKDVGATAIIQEIRTFVDGNQRFL
jgi:hypothetical protein